MSILTQYIGKSYIGSNGNKTIKTVRTGEIANSGVLDIYIESPFLSTSYEGSIIDMNAVKNTNSIEPIINFKLQKINIRDQKIKINDLEEIIKKDYANQLFDEENFEKQINLAENNLIFQGYILNRNGRTGVKIKKIEYQQPDVNTSFDVAGIEKVTKDAFNNLINHKYNSKQKTIKEVETNPITKKYTSKSAVVGIYDGEIEEYQPITQTPKKQITRASNIKSEHIRLAHKKCYKNGGSIREIALPPTIIHLNQFHEADLMEYGFQKNGEPSIEALYLYRGQLSDFDLQKLNEANNFKLLKDLTGEFVKNVDYDDLNRIFSD
jgi:hypothetical protein